MMPNTSHKIYLKSDHHQMGLFDGYYNGYISAHYTNINILACRHDNNNISFHLNLFNMSITSAWYLLLCVITVDIDGILALTQISGADSMAMFVDIVSSGVSLVQKQLHS